MKRLHTAISIPLPFGDDDLSRQLQFKTARELRHRAVMGRSSIGDAELMLSNWRQLTLSALRPALKQLGLLMSADEFQRLSVSERRRLAALALEYGLPIPHADLGRELSEGLRGLEAGKVADLLQKGTSRRGKAPERSAEAELRMLVWIAWQVGIRRKVREAEADVAKAVGCSIEAVRSWRQSIGKIYGPEFLKEQLRLSRLIGYHEARGTTIGELRPDNDDDHLVSTRWNLERDLLVLAQMRREAIEKRAVRGRKRVTR